MADPILNPYENVTPQPTPQKGEIINPYEMDIAPSAEREVGKEAPKLKVNRKTQLPDSTLARFSKALNTNPHEVSDYLSAKYPDYVFTVGNTGRGQEILWKNRSIRGRWNALDTDNFWADMGNDLVEWIPEVIRMISTGTGAVIGGGATSPTVAGVPAGALYGAAGGAAVADVGMQALSHWIMSAPDPKDSTKKVRLQPEKFKTSQFIIETALGPTAEVGGRYIGRALQKLPKGLQLGQGVGKQRIGESAIDVGSLATKARTHTAFEPKGVIAKEWEKLFEKMAKNPNEFTVTVNKKAKTFQILKVDPETGKILVDEKPFMQGPLKQINTALDVAEKYGDIPENLVSAFRKKMTGALKEAGEPKGRIIPEEAAKLRPTELAEDFAKHPNIPFDRMLDVERGIRGLARQTRSLGKRAIKEPLSKRIPSDLIFPALGYGAKIPAYLGEHMLASMVPSRLPQMGIGMLTSSAPRNVSERGMIKPELRRGSDYQHVLKTGLPRSISIPPTVPELSSKLIKFLKETSKKKEK